ncbi:40S ribosomal protein SA-like [Asparagus officinalis]|uniref:40S ribosomal protein SA-like n=1 Tax=Asparagus officinalis TaxID=4686 RepID=UPI00098E5482|nr:40S ribosomal protein SA-like [Asparagus officinalis]XP_020258304.1 40S ribosomal protein SA-like [Asparagus officinalis]
MVDLFFYREPEEAKEQEEAEAPVAPDYGAVAEFIGMGMATSGLLTNGQTWELVPLSLQFLLVTGLLFQNATDGSQHG